MPLRPPAGFIRPGYDPLKVPNAPTIGTATGGSTTASVAFTAPSNTGGSVISAYYAVSNPGQITGSGASSPVTVSGLTNGTSYTFSVWALNTYGPSPYSASSNSVTPAVSELALFAGGTSASGDTNIIDYVNITTTGNATDFGDLIHDNSGVHGPGSCASSTRGVVGGGNFAAPDVNVIQYVTFASAGNATDFGDLLYKAQGVGGCNSATRGLFGAGAGSVYENTINYITIASVGNATDFGDLTEGRFYPACFSSSTRGVWAGGSNASGYRNVIDYVTIASTGNASDFGDLTVARDAVAGCSTSTRGCIGGGTSSGGQSNIIDYVTIATTANATDFGDLTVARQYLAAASGTTRGLWAGGSTPRTNVIDYVTMASVGNATDFGDLTVARNEFTGFSNSNGGV